MLNLIAAIMCLSLFVANMALRNISLAMILYALGMLNLISFVATHH